MPGNPLEDFFKNLFGGGQRGGVVNPNPYGEPDKANSDVAMPGQPHPSSPAAPGSPATEPAGASPIVGAPPPGRQGFTDPLLGYQHWQDMIRKMIPPGGFTGWPGVGGPGGGPPAPDFRGAAEDQAKSSREAIDRQTNTNRPNQSNAYGASVNWHQNPDGTWTQSQDFGSGGLGQAANGIMGQLGSAYSNPFSFTGPGIMSGDAARDQAITGAYNQATSRLDPQFSQREQALRSQLLNQGLDPSSEAFQTAMGNFGRERNDAYSTAMNGAIAQGTAAGDSIFRNSLAGHDTAYGEQRQAFNDPMALAQMLNGFTGQAGFNQAGAADPTQYLPAAAMQGNHDMDIYKIQNGQATDTVKGFTNLLMSLAQLFPEW